ncbi:Cytoplasmic polyadenylation element-binding protein 4 [Xenoophorus captivus]|uniref:Cytoplasmic polyadenylation element-binding protein 4 n=1 Tax=Xenoophorus captivus TaxID=1517983 RepID=A0ABV0SFY1_9TELE
MEDSFPDDERADQGLAGLGSPHCFPHQNGERVERYSRKVFVGGLPPDIDEGYAFLLFQDESSVQALIDACIEEDGKLYLCVSSPTIKDKPVSLKPHPFSLCCSGFYLTLVELAMIMDRLYGGVCYAGIDTDPELKYPKGAGRVAFSNQQSYIAAISARFVQLQHGEIDKRVEVKPYVLDDQLCDECQGTRCGGKFAPFFCANVTCLQYYCEYCWAAIHSRAGREFHKPLVKEGGDRPRHISFRWN